MIFLKGSTEGVVQLGWREPLLTQGIKDLKEKKTTNCQHQVPQPLQCSGLLFVVTMLILSLLSSPQSSQDWSVIHNLYPTCCKGKCFGLFSSWNFLFPSFLHTTSVLSFSSQGRVFTKPMKTLEDVQWKEDVVILSVLFTKIFPSLTI